MSEKDESKRGILSSLLGLFGEEEEGVQQEKAADQGVAAPNGAVSEWTPIAPPAPPTPPTPPTPGGPPAARHEPPPTQEQAHVVREAYEPGWYAVSSQYAPPPEDHSEQGSATPSESPTGDELKRFVPGDDYMGTPAAGHQFQETPAEATMAPRAEPAVEPMPQDADSQEAEAREAQAHEAAAMVVESGWEAGHEPASDLAEPGPAAEAPPSEPDVAAVAAAASPAVTPGLFSRSASDRRQALEELLERGVGEEDVDSLARLLHDPERDIRREATEGLAQRADLVDADTVRKAILDPTDEVRAAAVRLAGARSAGDVPELLPVVASRHWPLSQQAALAVVPHLVARTGLDETRLAALMAAVGGMDSQPVEAERAGFAALAESIGRDRLAATLDRDGTEALGAARLLVEEGSSESLRAVAARAETDDDDMRIVAQMAADLLGDEPTTQQEVPMETEASVEAPGLEPEASTAPRAEMVAGLAAALHDPDDAVRTRAREALANLDRETLTTWVREAIGGRDADQASLAAEAAGAVSLADLAPQILERAAELAPEARGGFVRALSSFEVEPAALAGLIHGVDSSRRPEAIRVLWQVSGRPVLPHLRELLTDSQAMVRVAVLDAFGESGDPSAMEVAWSVLERDSSPHVRATAIQVIGRAGLDQREAALAQALTDPDPDVRATAVEVLPAGTGRRAGQLLLEALSDQDERVWRAAIRHLASLPERDRAVAWMAIVRCPESRRQELVATLERTSSEALSLLATDHLSSPDPSERALAITLAGRAGRPESVRGIAAALQDPTPQVRRVAARALATARSSDAIPALARALSDPDLEVRMASVQALSMIDDDDVLDPLITALKDPEVRVREVAGEALARWRSPAVARRLAMALAMPSLRRPAGDVLARMGTAAVDPLVDILLDEEEDGDLSATVGQILRDLVGADLFLERLSNMDADERLRAVEVLGAIGDEPGLDGLIRALSDPVENIRIRAVTLLGDSGSPRALEPLKRTFLSDPVLEVVAAAEEALRRLQPGGDAPPQRES